MGDMDEVLEIRTSLLQEALKARGERAEIAAYGFEKADALLRRMQAVDRQGKLLWLMGLVAPPNPGLN